jgi:hypothetical protein
MRYRNDIINIASLFAFVNKNAVPSCETGLPLVYFLPWSREGDLPLPGQPFFVFVSDISNNTGCNRLSGKGAGLHPSRSVLGTRIAFHFPEVTIYNTIKQP